VGYDGASPRGLPSRGTLRVMATKWQTHRAHFVAIVLLLGFTTGGCSRSDGLPYPSAKSLSPLPAGMKIVDATHEEERDCEGPHCWLHLVLSGSDRALPDLVASLQRGGWLVLPSEFPGQTSLCKKHLYASIASKGDLLKAKGREDAQSWPTLKRGSITVVLNDHLLSCSTQGR
jgi:hypothetical protein